MEIQERENKVNDFWDDAKIFEKQVNKDAPNGEYTFYDGPPFATGLPHYGHIVASIIKDVVPRFWAMNGYKVERKWGWDCHGLPIENIVEKELNFQNKKDIEKLGIDKFNNLCRSKVTSYVEDWKKVIRQLGRFVDMQNSYKTMDLDFMESVWWVFKEIYDKDLVYKGYRSMHICPRCQTTLSQSEVTEGYKDIKDLSAIAKFKLIEDENTSVLAWTTTPWTLIGNVALAVGKNIDYVKIERKDETGKITKFILAKDKLKEIFKEQEYKIIEEFKGKKLVGKKYKPLFDYYIHDKSIENKENGWKIVLADFVSTDEGTGIVHIAPAFGEDDMNLGQKENLPFIQHVGIDGIIEEKAKDFAGMNVKPIKDHMQTDIEIIKYLANKDLLFSKEKYEHSYPHCWRCDTPLLNYATSSWFVNVTKIKKRLLQTAENINWSPNHIKEGRWGNWLKGARDWSISRQRFWASAIPIWECSCGEIKVIGSVKELENLSGKKITDIHKDTVDKIQFPCSKCKKQMTRIPDVFDCWFESGAMPFAQLHYPFENKERFNQKFPAQFIAEGADQTRCWFYYLHVLAIGVKDKEAFKNVIVNGIVLAEDGKKMSKKLQNYPDPTKLMDKYGADALRYYLLMSPVMLADNLNFSEKGVLESYKKLIMILTNIVKFYNELKIENIPEKKSKNILDKWIISRLNQLLKETDKAMREYNLPSASRPIVEFVDDLSTWYLRLNRDRLNEQDPDAIKTLHDVLLMLSKIIAPFTPFISEEIWQEITKNNFKDKNKSVHLEEWPKYNEKLIDSNLINKMTEVREVVSVGLKQRDQNKVGLKWPLSSATISYKKAFLDGEEELKELIKQELNVKGLKILTDSTEKIKVELDFNLTPELENEGYAREISRQVQSFRKDLGLNKQDIIELKIITKDKEFAKIIEDQKEFIQDRTNSKNLSVVTTDKERFKNKIDFKIKDKRGEIVVINY